MCIGHLVFEIYRTEDVAADTATTAVLQATREDPEHSDSETRVVQVWLACTDGGMDEKKSRGYIQAS